MKGEIPTIEPYRVLWKREEQDNKELREEIERLNNIIKEAIEYIEEAQERDEDKESCSLYIPKLLEILDKGESNE